MSRIPVYLITLLLLYTLPVHADEAMDYFNLAQKGSVTRKKIELFTKALELNPKLAAAYEQRGLLYYFQEKYDKVIQDYQTYLDLAPEKAQAYRMLGLGYLKTGEYEPAIANFSRAIELEPQHPAGYAYRAEANRLRGKDEEAIRDATAAVKLRGDMRAKSEAYKTRARAYRKLGLMDLAYADTRSAWESDPRWSYWVRYWYKYASLEELRGAGLVGIIVLALVLVFGLKIKPPGKEE
ncbi:MAG: tetratricopeptide repeat protein [Deltaproteobacteria bacterium]|jgi:tetratricopeptide (TPR) repeat protein|nr:tetratricopeptide repeat protein [Deltaproteobacteria bacterium]